MLKSFFWTKTSATDVLDLAEALCAVRPVVAPHSYFLSYSWGASEAEADHVELLLRRSARQVYRDEGAFASGRDLTNEITSIIGQTDTFLVLHSEGWENSQWCPGELTYALLERRDNGKPARVITPRSIPYHALAARGIGVGFGNWSIWKPTRF